MFSRNIYYAPDKVRRRCRQSVAFLFSLLHESSFELEFKKLWFLETIPSPEVEKVLALESGSIFELLDHAE